MGGRERGKEKVKEEGKVENLWEGRRDREGEGERGEGEKNYKLVVVVHVYHANTIETEKWEDYSKFEYPGLHRGSQDSLCYIVQTLPKTKWENE